MSEVILCLDLGTKTGWAKHTPGRIDSGVTSFKNGSFEGGGMRYVKFDAFLRRTVGLIDISMSYTIYFEAVRAHKGTAAAHIYGGFLATLTSFCENRSIPYEGIPVGTIKKFVTQKGNASKQEVMDAISQKGFSVNDDNQADALALLFYVMKRSGLPQPF